MRRLFGITVVLVVMAVGCGKKDSPDKVTFVADDDPRMNAAMEKARSTVNTFIAALRSRKAGRSAFSVKTAFSDGDNVEHMWLTQVNYDGKSFHGTVNNEPQKVNNVRMGQRASVERSRISDWMFVENRRLVGGYTLRVLRDAMPDSERAEFDQSVPFVID